MKGADKPKHLPKKAAKKSLKEKRHEKKTKGNRWSPPGSGQ